MGEQGVQEGAEHAPLWGPRVEDQRNGEVVSYLHHLGSACQEVQYPIAQDLVETQGIKLNDDLEGYYGVECLVVINSCRQLTAFLHRYSSCPDGIGQSAV